MELRDLVGRHILQGIGTGIIEDRYGESCNYVDFKLDDTTYRAVEDPQDGWRSYLQDLQIISRDPEFVFSPVSVFCSMDDKDSDDVLYIYDSNTGKEILAIGTRDIDDWYPCCIMEYHPENMKSYLN